MHEAHRKVKLKNNKPHITQLHSLARINLVATTHTET